MNILAYKDCKYLRRSGGIIDIIISLLHLWSQCTTDLRIGITGHESRPSKYTRPSIKDVRREGKKIGQMRTPTERGINTLANVRKLVLF